MKLASDSFANGQPLPAEFAMGTREGFGGNRNPELHWSDTAAGTRSFALLCIDPDAPTDAALAGKPGMEIPVEHPRGDFVHWVLIDIPANQSSIAAGAASHRVTEGGKRDGRFGNARQGLNDYTAWFASDDSGMRGDYLGYDGPWPPDNDLRMHRYFFRLFALDVPALDVPERFTAPDVFRAIHGHVLDETAIHGTYSLHG